jgi:hypothetical protein
MSSFNSIIVVLALMIQVVSCSALAAPVWDITETNQDGVPHLMNPASPRDGQQIIPAVQQWRMGADEANDPIFGLAQDAITDDQGNTYLLDAVMSTVYVISPEGEVLRQIGAEGDGPGEFRNGNQLVFMPDGSLGILEMMPGQIICLDLEGNPRSSFHPGGSEGGGMNHFQNLAVDGDQVILGGVSTTFDNEGVTVVYSLTRYHADGSVAQVVRERKDVQTGGNVSISLGGDDEDITGSWVLAANGEVVLFPRPFEYGLEYYDRKGQPARVVKRTYETIRRSDEDIAAARKQAEEMSARFTGMTMEVEERARDISALYPRPDGSLWVACSQGDRARPEGSLGVFDVIDPDGRYLRTVRIDGVDYDPGRDNFTIDGDRLYVYKEAQKAPARTSTSGGGGMTMVMMSVGSPAEEEDDGEQRPFEVICYRLGS